METSWSLHLLSEILSAFSAEDPQNLLSVLNRVAEAVDAEAAVILHGDAVRWSVGLGDSELQLLRASHEADPAPLPIAAGSLFTYWAPMGEHGRLVVGRLEQGFDLEERSLLRAMARSIHLSLQLLDAIQAEQQSQLRAQHQANHDPLTGLPNRQGLLQALSARIDCPPAEAALHTAVLLVDLDRFKWINDAHGQAIGDELLVRIGQQLQGLARPGDLVGRLAGDEFLLIAPVASKQTARELAQACIDAIAAPVPLAGSELVPSASVGISFVLPGESASEVIENASMATYRAKGLGRGRFALFHPRLRDQARKRLSLEEGLRHAVQNGEIETWLQPIYRAADLSLAGFEALARWRHPGFGLQAPASFIHEAEDTGLIQEIDLEVLRQASTAISRWQEQFQLPVLKLSCNVSARTLVRSGITARVGPILAASGLAAEQVWLEITETSLMEDIQATVSTIDELRQLGLQLAIDDFGTGYSSLVYLKRFPVAVLKIDRSFVSGLGSGNPGRSEDEAIARAIISLARALGLAVVAEGVETVGQQRCLQALGCDYLQGYLYAKPRSLADMEAELAGAGGGAALSGPPRPTRRRSHSQRV
jgi:diguanylate cyclase (GGDEF)-like protein